MRIWCDEDKWLPELSLILEWYSRIFPYELLKMQKACVIPILDNNGILRYLS